MAGATARTGLWEEFPKAESSTSQFKFNKPPRSSLWDYPAVEYGPGSAANGNHRTFGESSTSGIGSSAVNSAAPGPVNGNGNGGGDVKGKGKAPAIGHDLSWLNAGGLPPVACTLASFLSSDLTSDYPCISEYDAAYIQSLDRGGTPALPVPSGLMSPFAPGHHSSESRPSAPFGGLPRVELPPFVGPQNPGRDGPQCHCPICSSASPAMCFQQRLARQQASIHAVWDDERTRLEMCRSRVEGLVREEGRIILDHYRQGWDDERERLQSEIMALRETIEGLSRERKNVGDERDRLWSENVELKEENSRLKDASSKPRGETPQPGTTVPDQARGQGGVAGTASHRSNFQSIFTNSNPSDPANSGQGQGDRPTEYNGGRIGRSSWSASSDPTSWSTLFHRRLRVPWPVQAPTRGTSRSPPPSGTFASQDQELPDLPPQRCMSMSPQPGDGAAISSPVLPFYPSSPIPSVETLSAAASGPTRSPKRPLSVMDVNEVDPGLDGISLRANTVRRATFAEDGSDGAPPSKRQRSLSQEYCIVDNLSDDDDEDDDDVDGEGDEEEGGERDGEAGGERDGEAGGERDGEADDERDEEEVRRLKMHAGHTPPHSPPMGQATTSRFSQGSATPVPSSTMPERKPLMPGAMTTAEALRSTSDDDDSGDAPLEGPLMIQNVAAEDDHFLAALNERLEPISQGRDALPRAVQAPIEMPAPLSAVRGERVGIRPPDAQHAALSGSMNLSVLLSDDDEEREKIRIYLGDIGIGGGEAPVDSVKVEQPAVPVKREDVRSDDSSDDDGDGVKAAEPEVPIRFRSTSNFGAPFGRM
ncbi:hypothetical protein J3F83DRAFT_16636 [Trichoderma novae-zelandiae]